MDYNNDMDEDDDFNRFLPTEFIKKLPGITSNNIGDIIKRVRNVLELCLMQEDEIKKIIGPKNAKELKNFFENRVNPDEDYSC